MQTFRAVLNGRNEVPPVQTISTGNAVFRVSGNRIRFRLIVRDITRMTQAHIHLGRRGENGPVVTFLFGPSRFGVSARRGVIRGVIRSQDLVGPLRGRTINDLVREMRNGNAYVNVHTIRHPDGEIRGQIRR